MNSFLIVKKILMANIDFNHHICTQFTRCKIIRILIVIVISINHHRFDKFIIKKTITFVEICHFGWASAPLMRLLGNVMLEVNGR